MEQMPSMPQNIENNENTEKKTFREKLERKLKRLVTMGFTVSALLAGAATTAEAQEHDGLKTENLFIKATIDGASVKELKQLDHTVDSLSTVLYTELKQRNLGTAEQDGSSYKNWHFRNTGSEDIDVSWSEKGEDGHTTVGYEYLTNTSRGKTFSPDGHVISEDVDRKGDISYYSNNLPKNERYSDYSYYGKEDHGGTMLKGMAHVLDKQEVQDHSTDNVKEEMVSTLNEFKHKLEAEIETFK